MTDSVEVPLESVFSYLCSYDPRSPSYADLTCSYDEEDPMPPPARSDCYCDDCFYGRDPLAREILRLRALAGLPTTFPTERPT